MRKPLVRALAMFLMAAVLMLYGAPVFAGDDLLTKSEVDALIQQYLPEGVYLEEADEMQISEAIAKAVQGRPDDAMNIAFRAAERVPNYAAAIATAAATVFPDRSSDIAIAVSRAVPEQATTIRNIVEQAVPDQQQKAAAGVLERSASQTEQSGTQPPARDDNPASPVK